MSAGNCTPTASPPSLHRWEIANPKAAVHVIHGIVEHGCRYERFAKYLNDKGITVWAHDHRGHGWNPDPDLGLGHFGDHEGWRLLIDDAWSVSTSLMQANPGVPVFLFAHSMGSFVGQALMGEHGDGYAGVVLAGTDGPPNASEGAARLALRLSILFQGGRARATAIQNRVFSTYNEMFKPNRTTADWLTRDGEEVDKYLADDHCNFVVTLRSWLDFLEGRRVLTTSAHLDKIPQTLPVHVIAGTRDPVGKDAKGVQALLELYRKHGLSHLTHTLYDDARHELVNETNRDEVMASVADWILGQATRR